MAKTTLGGAARSTAQTIQAINAVPPPSETSASTPTRPGPASRRPTNRPKWEETNRRTNVWMPVGLPERIRAELARRGDGRTMSALVVDLLTAWEHSA